MRSFFDMDLSLIIAAFGNISSVVAIVGAVFAGLTYWVMRDQLIMMRAASNPIVDFSADDNSGIPLLRIVIVNPGTHSLELTSVEVLRPKLLTLALPRAWSGDASGLAKPSFDPPQRKISLQSSRVVFAKSMLGAVGTFAPRSSETLEFLFVPPPGWTGGEVRLRLSILIKEARSRRSSLTVSRDIRCDWNATMAQPNANAAVAIRKSSAIKSILDSMSA